MLTIFHFRCNLCGARPIPVALNDYLTAWTTAARLEVEHLLLVVAGALNELAPPWITKKARRAIEKTLGHMSALTTFDTCALSEHAGELYFAMTCPMCYTPGGVRPLDRYIAPWHRACRVQTGNILYETSLILWAVTAAVPTWANVAALRTLDTIRESLRPVAEAMRLEECPQCGRWTTCIFGDPSGPRDARFCRWCLDAGGGGAVGLTVNIDADGRPTITFHETDPVTPAAEIRNLLPPRRQ